MATSDVNGRNYVRLSNLKPGNVVQLDGDFTCIKPWSHRVVRRDDHGLFVRCDGPDGECKPLSEKHYLDGQLDHDTDALVGVYLVTP